MFAHRDTVYGGFVIVSCLVSHRIWVYIYTRSWINLRGVLQSLFPLSVRMDPGNLREPHSVCLGVHALLCKLFVVVDIL